MEGGRSTAQLKLLERLLPVYEEVLKLLQNAGVNWVQIDEPCLVLDWPGYGHPAFHTAYQRLNAIGLPLLVATYFGGLRDNLPTALSLSVAALHLDCVRQPEELDTVLKQLPPGTSLSLGVVDGRNIWRTNLDRAFSLVRLAVEQLGQDRVMVGPSCSLLHDPEDLTLANHLDPGLNASLSVDN